MDIMQYYGSDWIAMLLSVVSVWMLGSRRRSGFVVMILGNSAWIAYGMMVSNLPLILSNVVFVALNLRGYMNWTVKSEAM